ncbi:MAG: DNA topoisomerase I [Candidatus Bathyarchaeota archaeon]|nr:DNA topoisomerase I [Candidatus Bathyarchaeota archaeon]MDH5494172.1 DNA topoisomerase I [Candidatus Bathyarchaeota archaeon]
MKHLIHNGALIPKRPEWRKLHISVQGKRIDLTPEQEEMAVAWVTKLGTAYVEDPVFIENFFLDFRKALGTKKKVPPEDFNFSPVIKQVEREKAYKLSLTKEEKKKLAAERKAIREKNKEKHGVAIVDGIKVEVGNYTVEPSSIFMGRGDHPLRGRWKRGAGKSDIILNLSPDAPRPPGNWKEILWQQNSMWIAKWDDKLRGKEKYIWLADSSPIKQQKDIEKFNKAIELGRKIEEVRKHILSNLDADEVTIRKIATVCYLVDALKLRVGDEKDTDEADTVGATTLRSDHITFGKNGVVIFDFLGKDAVRWQKRIRPPKQVVDNIKEFMKSAMSSIFEGVGSKNVSLFLDEVAPGVSAKVFRTYHASRVVADFLNSSDISKPDPEYEKKHVATMANLEAAIICNHKRKPRKNWEESLVKKMERLKKLRARNTPSAKKRAKILQSKINAFRETRDYNLGTSLKSYIDPRIYYKWGQKVDFDWKLYYPKALQKKFSWVERETV